MPTEVSDKANGAGRPSRVTRILRFFSRPAFNIAVGGAVVVCSGAELVGDVESAGSVRAAHGMILLGVVHALRSLGELGAGTHKLVHPDEELT